MRSFPNTKFIVCDLLVYKQGSTSQSQKFKGQVLLIQNIITSGKIIDMWTTGGSFYLKAEI